MDTVTVITGASSGIGRELALTLAAQQRKVLAIARRKKELDALKKCFPDFIECCVADIASEQDREKIIALVSKQYTLNALVNNAALMQPSGLLKNIGLEAWRYQMAVNVEAPLFLTVGLAPYLQHGRVLNITIYSSFKVTKGLAAYGVSKAALNMMTEYLRDELKEQHIAVGLMLPGIVDTPIQNQLPEGVEFDLRDRIDALKINNQITTPKMSAAFISRLLFEMDAEEFSGKTWDIIDAHQ